MPSGAKEEVGSTEVTVAAVPKGAVDPVEAPSTGTVVRGGLTFREAHYVAEAVSDTGNLKSMDIVEVNPQLEPGDGANMTADMGLQLTLSAMGTRIL